MYTSEMRCLSCVIPRLRRVHQPRLPTLLGFGGPDLEHRVNYYVDSNLNY